MEKVTISLFFFDEPSKNQFLKNPNILKIKITDQFYATLSIVFLLATM